MRPARPGDVRSVEPVPCRSLYAARTGERARRCVKGCLCRGGVRSRAAGPRYRGAESGRRSVSTICGASPRRGGSRCPEAPLADGHGAEPRTPCSASPYGHLTGSCRPIPVHRCPGARTGAVQAARDGAGSAQVVLERIPGVPEAHGGDRGRRLTGASARGGTPGRLGGSASSGAAGGRRSRAVPGATESGGPSGGGGEGCGSVCGPAVCGGRSPHTKGRWPGPCGPGHRL